jgi:hypothetical protein
MKFTPKTEEQLKAEANTVWPKGEYEFEVLSEASFGQKTLETVNRTSNAGNDMLQLIVKVYNPDGKTRNVVDYLMETMGFKLRHACEACGLVDNYNSGELSAHDFIGKIGKLTLDIQPESVGKDGKTYSEKNVVKDYVKPASAAAVSHSKAKANAYQAQTTAEALDDEVPF